MSNPPSRLVTNVRNGFVYAGVIALGAVGLTPIIKALWRVLGDLLAGRGEQDPAGASVQVTTSATGEVTAVAPDGIYTDSLRVGWAIVAAGLIIACMVILLRLKIRQEDERGPPLAPALAMVAVGAALIAVVSLAR